MIHSDCPSRVQLRHFVACLLSDDEVEEIADHLETCHECDRIVTTIEEERMDSSLGSVNSAKLLFEHEPEYRALVKKAAATRVSPENARFATPPPIPEIPDYRIDRFIDQGGMGAVFEAVHTETDRRVAIKVLHEGTDRSPQALQMFLREAHVLSQLTHPSIVRFEGVGKYRDAVFIAMEYVDSIDLMQRLQSLSFERRIRLACGLIYQILGALDLAHRKGLVHRDIKPGNILVTKSDNKLLAKVSDFGLAKSFETAGFSGITREGETRGTLGYMAPEQFKDSRSVKPAADLYSVGVTLFYYISDRLPFETLKNPAEASRVLCLPPIRLSDLCVDVPEDLCGIVSRAISFQPSDRFPSAAAFREALLPFVRPSGK